MSNNTEGPWRPAGDGFGLRLWLVRRHTHKNKDEFTSLCGLKRGEVARWEEGSLPRDMARAVRQISQATGVDPVWLMYGEEPPVMASDKGESPMSWYSDPAGQRAVFPVIEMMGRHNALTIPGLPLATDCVRLAA